MILIAGHFKAAVNVKKKNVYDVFACVMYNAKVRTSLLRYFNLLGVSRSTCYFFGCAMRKSDARTEQESREIKY